MTKALPLHKHLRKPGWPELYSYKPTPIEGATSPWGQIQKATALAPGLVMVETASHGGVWVAPNLLDKIPEDECAFARVWSGWANWFEEDVCVASVALAYPEAFNRATPETLKTARETLSQAMAQARKRGDI